MSTSSTSARFTTRMPLRQVLEESMHVHWQMPVNEMRSVMINVNKVACIYASFRL